MEQEIHTLKEDIAQLRTENTTLAKKLKSVERMMKKYKSETSNENDQLKPKRESFFQKPAPITKELAEFLNIDPSEHIARTKVTQAVYSYISENKLNNENMRREIIPDNKLKTIIPVDRLMWTDVQKHLKNHFVKPNNDSVPNLETNSENVTNTAEQQQQENTETNKPTVKKIIRKVVKKTT